MLSNFQTPCWPVLWKNNQILYLFVVDFDNGKAHFERFCRTFKLFNAIEYLIACNRDYTFVIAITNLF
jgi:hypothetical protein